MKPMAYIYFYPMTSLSQIDLLSLQHLLRLTKDDKGQSLVFDPIRKKHFIATPEEIVRQLWIAYFIETIKLNPRLIAIERSFELHGLKKRFDLILFQKDTQPLLLAEFKAPGVPLSQSTFDQIAQYNMKWNVPYALVSNGRDHYCFTVDHDRQTFIWHDALPM